MNSQVSNSEFRAKLQSIMEANMHNEHFGVAELAKEMGMSRSNLHRKVKKAANVSVNQLIRHERLKYALELLKTTSDTVSEIAYKTGFSSSSYFIKCFHDYYGYTPGEKLYDEEPANHGKPQVEFAGAKYKKKPIPNRKSFSGILMVSLGIILLFLTLTAIILPAINGKQKFIEPTIALLPPENMVSYSIPNYLDGLMFSVLDKLTEMDGWIIRPHTSMQQYRNTDKPLQEIAKEVNVNYAIKLSIATIGRDLVINVIIENAHDDITEGSEKFVISEYEDSSSDLHSDITLYIINSIDKQIASEERIKSSQYSTSNEKALKAYFQGLEFSELAMSHTSYGDNKGRNLVNQSIHYLKVAIKEDSLFTEALNLLAHNYISRFANSLGHSDIEKSEQYLDSGYVVLTIAKEVDPKNELTLRYMAYYYHWKGETEKSKKLWELALKYSNFSSKHWKKHYFLCWMYASQRQHYNSLSNFYQYNSKKPFTEVLIPNIFWSLWNQLSRMGFEKTADKYSKEILTYDSDTNHYINRLVLSEMMNGNFNNGVKYGEQMNHYDVIWGFHQCYYYTGEYTKAYQRVKLFITENYMLHLDDIEIPHIYDRIGEKAKADSCYKLIEAKNLKEIELNRPYAQRYESHFHLACIYAAQDKPEEAMKYLRQLKNRKVNDIWLITRMKYSPMLDNIKSEPEFKEILERLEKRFRLEQEKIRELLLKEGELEEGSHRGEAGHHLIFLKPYFQNQPQ